MKTIILLKQHIIPQRCLRCTHSHRLNPHKLLLPLLIPVVMNAASLSKQQQEKWKLTKIMMTRLKERREKRAVAAGTAHSTVALTAKQRSKHRLERNGRCQSISHSSIRFPSQELKKISISFKCEFWQDLTPSRFALMPSESSESSQLTDSSISCITNLH